MPDGMRDRIKVAAQASGRSMNAEIVYRLEQSFSDDRARTLLSEQKPDDFATEFANYLSDPKNRTELEGLAALVRRMITKKDSSDLSHTSAAVVKESAPISKQPPEDAASDPTSVDPDAPIDMNEIASDLEEYQRRMKK
ncbi:MAG: Arc family DNA-binding protein [Candidimonas sp.]|nr:MAG: Arc family DNA-binding protein [Candidimonas sp.]